MISVTVVAALCVLAVATQVGVFVFAVITGTSDTIVSPEIHSLHFAKTVPGAKLIVLPNVGHMVQNAAPDLIIGEIESMIAASDTKPKSASR
jgi:hypothetical protein